MVTATGKLGFRMRQKQWDTRRRNLLVQRCAKTTTQLNETVNTILVHPPFIKALPKGNSETEI